MKISQIVFTSYFAKKCDNKKNIFIINLKEKLYLVF